MNASKLRGLLDTTVLIDLPDHIRDTIGQFAASTVSRAEMKFGVSLLQARCQQDPSLRQTVALRQARLGRYDALDIWLSFGIKESEEYGRIAAHAHASGPGPARYKDGLIAAHAVVLGVPVVTSNVTDFLRFGVSVVAPEDLA